MFCLSKAGFRKGVLASLMAAVAVMPALASAPNGQVKGESREVVRDGDSASVVKEYGDKGYWFYKDREEMTPLERLRLESMRKQRADKKEKARKKSEAVAKGKSKQVDCSKGWKPGCGFVVPKTWEEQERMRDYLMHQAYLHPEDANAVEQWQRYLRWIVKQSVRMVSTWKFNQLNNPELDPRVNNPVSTLGLTLATAMKRENEKELWELLKALNARLFIFTKSSCDWCHKQMRVMYLFKKHIRIPVTEVSIEGECVNTLGFECVKGDLALKSAAILQADVVPSMYLYFPQNIWIKVSNGFVVLSDLKERMKTNFFAWRSAALKGLAKSSDKRGIVTTPTGVQLDLGGTGWGESAEKNRQMLEKIKQQLIEEGRLTPEKASPMENKDENGGGNGDG